MTDTLTLDALVEDVARAIAGAIGEDYMEDHGLFDCQARAALTAVAKRVSAKALADAAGELEHDASVMAPAFRAEPRRVAALLRTLAEAAHDA